jgi:hypothetical protein
MDSITPTSPFLRSPLAATEQGSEITLSISPLAIESLPISIRGAVDLTRLRVMPTGYSILTHNLLDHERNSLEVFNNRNPIVMGILGREIILLMESVVDPLLFLTEVTKRCPFAKVILFLGWLEAFKTGNAALQTLSKFTESCNFSDEELDKALPKDHTDQIQFFYKHNPFMAEIVKSEDRALPLHLMLHHFLCDGNRELIPKKSTIQTLVKNVIHFSKVKSVLYRIGLRDLQRQYRYNDSKVYLVFMNARSLVQARDHSSEYCEELDGKETILFPKRRYLPLGNLLQRNRIGGLRIANPFGEGYIHVRYPEITPPAIPKIGSYYEVTRRLKTEELSKVEAYCTRYQATLRYQADQIRLIFESENILAIEAFINSHSKPKLFMAAFYGYKEGLISFGLFCRFADLLSIPDYKIRVQNLSDDVKAHLFKSLSDYLDRDEIELFFQKLNSLPIEDRLIFSYPTQYKQLPPEELDARANDLRACETLQYLGFNPFNLYFEKGSYRRFMLSSRAVEEFYRIEFPDTAVRLNPVLGISSIKDIRENGLNGTRDVLMFYVIPAGCFNTLKIIKEDTVDNVPCIEGDVKDHDLYHSWVSSAMPADIKELYIKMGLFIRAIALQNNERLGVHNTKALKSLAWMLTDLDCSHFTLTDKMPTGRQFKPVFEYTQLRPQEFSLELKFIGSLLHIAEFVLRNFVNLTKISRGEIKPEHLDIMPTFSKADYVYHVLRLALSEYVVKTRELQDAGRVMDSFLKARASFIRRCIHDAKEPKRSHLIRENGPFLSSFDNNPLTTWLISD